MPVMRSVCLMSVKEFTVELQRLPPYISVATAEHVKFIGKAVQMLRQPKGRFQGQDLLPYKNTLEYADSLRKLQEQPVFRRVAFERTIEGIRSKVQTLDRSNQHHTHIMICFCFCSYQSLLVHLTVPHLVQDTDVA